MENLTYICSLGIVAAINGVTGCLPPIPPLHELPLSVTSYWPFALDGTPIPYNYQADDSPDYTGNGTYITTNDSWVYAACPSDWVFSYGYTRQVTFWLNGEQKTVICADNFGNEIYRNVFWHGGYETWVLAIDVLTPEPLHQLVYEWDIEPVEVVTNTE